MTDAEHHRTKMAQRKAVQDAEVASKTIEKGLLIVHTGAGKGKSTAAFGLLLRMVGHGRRIGVVQFIKGAWDTGERRVLERFGDLVSWHSMGEGFTWETQDRARDIAACRAAWTRATEMMADPDLALLVLDELNIALRYDYLPLDEVLAALAGRPPALHVVVTGRNAKPALIEAADLVTEMTVVKHHFAAGVQRASRGSSSERRALMFQGTGSSVGKSLLVAGLARAAGAARACACARSSRRTCPTTPRSRPMAARSAAPRRCRRAPPRAAPSVHMNPVLLKPQSEIGAQIVAARAACTPPPTPARTRR